MATIPRKKAVIAKRLIDHLQIREEHRRKGRPEGRKSGHEILKLEEELARY